jgi:hypothetical protein
MSQSDIFNINSDANQSMRKMWMRKTKKELVMIMSKMTLEHMEKLQKECQFHGEEYDKDYEEWESKREEWECEKKYLVEQLATKERIIANLVKEGVMMRGVEGEVESKRKKLIEVNEWLTKALEKALDRAVQSGVIVRHEKTETENT